MDFQVSRMATPRLLAFVPGFGQNLPAQSRSNGSFISLTRFVGLAVTLRPVHFIHANLQLTFARLDTGLGAVFTLVNVNLHG